MTKNKDLIEKQEPERVLKEKEPSTATSAQTTKSTKNTQTTSLDTKADSKANALPVSNNSNKPVSSKKQDETNIRKRTISNEILKTASEEKPVSNSANTKKTESKQASTQANTKPQPKQREKIQLVSSSGVKRQPIKKSIVNEKKASKKRFFGTAIVLSVAIFVSISFMLFVWAANQEHLNINDLLSLVNRHFSINI